MTVKPSTDRRARIPRKALWVNLVALVALLVGSAVVMRFVGREVSGRADRPRGSGPFGALVELLVPTPTVPLEQPFTSARDRGAQRWVGPLSASELRAVVALVERDQLAQKVVVCVGPPVEAPLPCQQRGELMRALTLCAHGPDAAGEPSASADPDLPLCSSLSGGAPHYAVFLGKNAPMRTHGFREECAERLCSDRHRRAGPR